MRLLLSWLLNLTHLGVNAFQSVFVVPRNLKQEHAMHTTKATTVNFMSIYTRAFQQLSDVLNSHST